jgi:hypothetical protein
VGTAHLTALPLDTRGAKVPCERLSHLMSSSPELHLIQPTLGFWVFSALGFELRASHLPGTPPARFCDGFLFENYLPGAGFEPRSS